MRLKRTEFSITMLGLALSFAAMIVAGCGGGSRYSIGGTVSGLSGSLVLQNNGSGNLTVTANGNFTFAFKASQGNSYNVTVLTPSGGQHCVVSNGAGTVAGQDVSDIVVTCLSLNQMGGAMQGRSLSLSTAVSTLAGTGLQGSADNVTGTQASFGAPYEMATDGTNLYVADSQNNKIRMIAIASGAVTTLAGTGAVGKLDSTNGALATFNNPKGITTDGTILYVADTGNNLIRKIEIATGAVTTLAGTGAPGSFDSASGTSATFNFPAGITTDNSNLYVADTNNNKIRKIVIATGAVTTLAGTGQPGAADNSTGTSATFSLPYGITTDGANLYVADTTSCRIRLIIIATGAVTTLAGTGAQGSFDNPIGTFATFNLPGGITTDGTNLYVADTNNNEIRQVVIASGAVTTLAGSGAAGGLDNSVGKSATFSFPDGITTDGTNLYVADRDGYKIRKIQ